VEYSPGAVAGIDTIFYEARNNGSFTEPFGPARLNFESRCIGNARPDRCRVCGGHGHDCKVSCDKKGGTRDICGVCDGDGQSCLGCDNKVFSPARYDTCGICGGNGQSCAVACAGIVDKCGVCNGTNACCLSYKGFPTQRMDSILLEHTLNSTISELEALEKILQFITGFVAKYEKLHSHEEHHYENEFLDYDPEKDPSFYSLFGNIEENEDLYDGKYDFEAQKAYDAYLNSNEEPAEKNEDFNPNEYLEQKEHQHPEKAKPSSQYPKPHHHSLAPSSKPPKSKLPQALSNLIISLNNFCSTTDEYIAILETFLEEYGQEIRVPWPRFNFPFSLSD